MGGRGRRRYSVIWASQSWFSFPYKKNENVGTFLTTSSWWCLGTDFIVFYKVCQRQRKSLLECFKKVIKKEKKKIKIKTLTLCIYRRWPLFHITIIVILKNKEVYFIIIIIIIILIFFSYDFKNIQILYGLKVWRIE